MTTLAELKQAVRERADIVEDGGNVSESELTRMINQSKSELWDLIALLNPSLLSKNSPVLTQVGDRAYRLPTDFYQLVSIDYYTNGGYVPGIPFEDREHARLSADPPDEDRFRYQIRIDEAAGFTYLYTFPALDENNLAVVYVPNSVNLTSDAQSFAFPNNWVEFIEVAASIRVLAKNEMDVSVLAAQKAELTRRIRGAVSNNDSTMPKTIQRVYNEMPKHRGLK